MHTMEEFDLSVLPEDAQSELYDFYLFLRQRNGMVRSQATQSKEQDAWNDIIEMNKKHPIKVDPSIDIRELIDQTHEAGI